MLAGLLEHTKRLAGAPLDAAGSSPRATTETDRSSGTTRTSSSGPRASPVVAVPRPTTTTAVDTHREINLTCVGIAVTLVAALLSLTVVAGRVVGQRATVTWPQLITGLVFLLIVAYLIYGSLVYQLSRFAYLRRLLFHRRTAPEQA